MKSKLLAILISVMLSCLCLFTLTACENGDNGGDTPPTHEHSFTNYISDNNASCIANGTETAKCDNCDATDTREIAGSKLPHSFTNYISDNNASIDNDGTKTAKCDNCVATDTITDEGSKLIPTDTSAFTFNNGTITGLTDYGKTLTEIIIPNKINGDTVTSIGDWAFDWCDSLTSIVIPDSVTSIGSDAFYSCNSLTSVTIGNGVTSIGNWAFSSCDSLTSIVISDSVTSIGDSAFYRCYSLTSVTIGNSVTSIGTSAFYNCYKLVEVINNSPNITVQKGSEDNGYLGHNAVSIFNSCDTYVNRFTTDSDGYVFYTEGEDKILVNYVGEQTELTLPNDTTEIHKYTFYNNDKITSVVIPDSVTNIGYRAFDNCDSLNYNVKGNLKYLGNSENPYLYLAGTTSDSITTATIDNNCKLIGSYAFSDCYWLTRIVIPDSVTSIGNYAFYNFDSLISVTIGNGVTSIGDWAFYDCSKLAYIKYRGSLSQWSDISFGYGCFPDTDNYTITCNDE